MKLNYKRTICVGFAFFLISAFWQAYDNTIPLILTNKFGLSQTVSGVIMALDNILALFMLPIFGAISDRCRSPKGRRTPFIVVGTIIAAVAFVALSFVDGMQLKEISRVSAIDDEQALRAIYQEKADEQLLTPDGQSFVLSEKFTEDEFAGITSTIITDDSADQDESQNQNSSRTQSEVTNPDYTKYVVPARQAVIGDITTGSPKNLILFIILLLITLVAMSAFRSPAVALMPDVTIKPLRSKGNAVINLMGSAGGIIALALGIVFATSALKNSMMPYTPYFVVIAGLMIVALILFRLTVNEPKFVIEMQEQSLRHGIVDDAGAGQSGDKSRKLSSGEKRSLILLLASIVLWFVGYNAIISKYSVYASTILHKDYNLTLILAQVAAIISYLPVGIIASKIGRKKTIIGGVIMLAFSFGAAATLRSGSPTLIMNGLFALAGIAWATINVNSFPMVVEMCSDSDVGKFTGFYYTASMAAQVITPVFSGFLMDRLGLTILFPYAAIFGGLALFTMIGVKHGDSRPEAKKGLDALEDME